MSISWGRRDRFKFSAGGAFCAWVPPHLAAVYSITYRKDPHTYPKAHTVLYFGESSDLSQDVASIDQLLDHLVDSDICGNDLYVFIHPMPGSTRMERSKVQQSLISDYMPRGNGY